MDTEIELVLIEDNPSDVELLMRSVKKHRLVNKIVVLKDGAEALDFFFEQNGPNTDARTPLVILLDLKLPKVDGMEVLRRLKSDERTKEIPVIVLTASQEDRDLKDAYRYGVNSYVTKPIDFKDFDQIVSQLEVYWLIVNKHPHEKRG